MAERGGFEPPDRINRSTDFESAAFDHSATSPYSTVCTSLSAGANKKVSFFLYHIAQKSTKTFLFPVKTHLNLDSLERQNIRERAVSVCDGDM